MFSCMNNFDKIFFKKYIPEWNEILGIVHGHFIIILNKIITNITILFLLPSFIYYKSLLLQENIDFLYFEIYLFCTFVKLIYDIFDWYNDVWIITNTWVVDLEWSFLSSNNVSLKFDNIEWVEVDQSWIWDSVLWKWNLIIHKIWEWDFTLKDASNPYKAVDMIEEFSTMNFDEDDETEEDEDRFEEVISILSDVIKNHLNTKKDEFEDEIIDEWEIIKEKAREKKWTIDLS